MIPLSHLSFVHCEQVNLQPKKTVKITVSHHFVAVERVVVVVCVGGGGGGAGERERGGRVVRWCWLDKLPVPERPTIWITVGQRPTAFAVGAGGGCLDIFTLIYPFFPLSPSLLGTARYRLKYCLKWPLNPKPKINQPGGAKAVRNDMIFCSFFNLTSLPFLINPSYIY